MMFAKKAQIMILDTFMFLILTLVILAIMSTIFINYSNNISDYHKKTELLKQEIIVEEDVLGCSGLGEINFNTKVCYKNKITIKNTHTLKEITCKIEIDDKIVFETENKKIKTTHKRGVIYQNDFKILKVSFCEK